MARKDYDYIGLPSGLSERLAEFLETEEAKKLGVGSKIQVITMLLRNFLEDYEAHKKRR